jgi:lysophospholipase L1-like esterase
MFVRSLALSALLVPLLPLAAAAQAPGPLVLKDGDRVVLLGSALIEHEQFHGYLETRLTRRFPDASVTFRNLGWSGDTVRGDARTGGFQNPEGFARLLKEVKAQRPTVIFIDYGTNESFEGPKGLPGFLKGMENMLDELAPLKARIVILSPTPHEKLGRPFPDPAQHNRHLEQYTGALEKLAKRRRVLFVDLFHALARSEDLFAEARPPMHWTSNGLLPNGYGYWFIADEVEERLNGPLGRRRIELDHTGKVRSSTGAKIAKVKAEPDQLRFDVVLATLPVPGPSDLPGGVPLPGLAIKGLPEGTYVLRVNGQEVCRHEGSELGRGIPFPDPALDRVEELRKAIVKKNALFYRRWRPFNDHERHWGFIGGDFKLYDAEIAKLEAQIARLRRPQPLHVEIVKEKAK